MEVFQDAVNEAGAALHDLAAAGAVKVCFSYDNAFFFKKRLYGIFRG